MFVLCTAKRGEEGPYVDFCVKYAHLLEYRV